MNKYYNRILSCLGYKGNKIKWKIKRKYVDLIIFIFNVVRRFIIYRYECLVRMNVRDRNGKYVKREWIKKGDLYYVFYKKGF